MSKTTFVDIGSGGPYDEWVGAGSQWESPFKLNVDGDKNEIKQLYREWIEKEDWLMEDVPSLKGLRLGGSSGDVHGEVLVEMVDGIELEEEKVKVWEEENLWYIRTLEGSVIKMNTKETAEMLLRLLEKGG